MRENKVRSLTESAMCVAFSVILCVLAAVFPTMSLAITAMSGLVSSIILVRCGYKYASLTYIASSILLFLLAPNRECAVYYVVLFGHYPMLRTFTERIGKKALVWIVKILEANILYTAVFVVATFIIGVADEVGTTEKVITALLFNIAFVLYDICVGKFMMAYISKHLQKHRFR